MSIWIHMFRFWICIWIHKYMNSCMNSHVQILNSHTWFHGFEFIDMYSLLKIENNSVFWICDVEFRSEFSEIITEICCMNLHLWIQRITTQISVMNSFMTWILWIHVLEFVRQFMVSHKKNCSSLARQFYPSVIGLLPLQDQLVI